MGANESPDDSTMKVYGTDAPRTERVRVGVADYAVTATGARLTTSGLGSCVGIALRDAASGVAGLAHVMLPAAAESSGGADGKFADTAVRAMLAEMVEKGADADAVVAKVAGGSTMLDFSSGAESIGARNAAAVRSELGARGIRIVAEDVGGTHGRSLAFDADAGDLEIRSANAGTRVI